MKRASDVCVPQGLGPEARGFRRLTGTIRNRSRSIAQQQLEERTMNGIIYLVGLVVVVMAVLSLIGLH